MERRICDGRRIETCAVAGLDPAVHRVDRHRTDLQDRPVRKEFPMKLSPVVRRVLLAAGVILGVVAASAGPAAAKIAANHCPPVV
jgi:hypothetical protein